MSHQISNKDLVIVLKEVLAAMEVKNYSFFKIRAYQNVIAAIDNLTLSVYDLWENNRLSEIPGIGGGLTQHLNDLFTKGKVPEFDFAKKDLPRGMFALIGLRGIGAKKAFKLATAFKLNARDTAVKKLKKAADSGKVQDLEGFGEKSEKLILEAISEMKKTKNEKTRLLLLNAEQVAERVIAYMHTCSGVFQINALGSLRRRNPTVGDIDIAVATEDSTAVMTHFLKFPEIAEVLVEGEKKISVVLKTDIQVDLRVIPPSTYGSMVQYFTGSKQHNILLRTYALEKGMSLSEYGIKQRGTLYEFATEEDFYKKLNLDYIPPELRHGKDEINLARTHKLPELITLDDIKGDLHTHTVASDGLNTLDEMIAAATSLDYAYIGIADHAPSVSGRGYGVVGRTVTTQRKTIDQLNASQDKIRILFGYEVNILADATLSLPEEFLEKLDFVIAGVHTAFNQDRDQMTHRLVSAIQNKYVDIIAHPVGRLINERDGCDIDWNQVFDAVSEYGKILEINAQPNRLDLTEDLVKDAITKGIKLIINTDAHDTASLGLMKYGIDVARRAGCTKSNILNTLSLEDLLNHLQKR